MVAKDVKAAMLFHVLYRLHSSGITEYGGAGTSGIADVFALAESGYTHEFEVKTSAADLAGELAAIRWLVPNNGGLFEGVDKPKRELKKTGKHRHYLGYGVSVYYDIAMRPNRFSFVVPEELKEKALAGIAGTPYGLYVVPPPHWKGAKTGEPVCAKRAEYLHKEKATPDTVYKIMRKACVEVEVLRGKDAKKRYCTMCEGALPTRCEKCDHKIEAERIYRKKSAKCWKEVGTLPIEEQSKAFNVCMGL